MFADDGGRDLRQFFFPEQEFFRLSWKVLLRPVVLLVFGTCITLAADLTIHLPDSASISRKSITYQCDSVGPRIGVPAGPFPVEYINGGGNSLAIVPITGNTLVFSNVVSGSGARYVASQYTWWEAHNTVTLYSDSLAGKMQSSCKPVNSK